MWTDGQTDMTKLILVFCSFTNMPENRLPCYRGTTINSQVDHRAGMLCILCMWTEFAKKSQGWEVCIKCNYHTKLWVKNVQDDGHDFWIFTTNMSNKAYSITNQIWTEGFILGHYCHKTTDTLQQTSLWLRLCTLSFNAFCNTDPGLLHFL